ncbi:hypothetical protein FRC19_010973 [Serendipita sp. 401]|nr:hypothetical protein FRC19_010973 [Serendipita sp. 401]KAG9052286.1 hypothetical protein FS842_010185 [Serendipita sp. 407]
MVSRSIGADMVCIHAEGTRKVVFRPEPTMDWDLPRQIHTRVSESILLASAKLLTTITPKHACLVSFASLNANAGTTQPPLQSTPAVLSLTLLPSARSHAMAFETFRIGICFQGLELSKPSSMTTQVPHSAGDINNSASTHWILVFSNGYTSRWVELQNMKGTVIPSIKDAPYELPAWYFGTYQGSADDIAHVALEHPMNGEKYSKSVNNCHHWVAIYLSHLSSFAGYYPPRYFHIADGYMTGLIFRTVVLSWDGVWNRLNNVLSSAMGVVKSWLK